MITVLITLTTAGADTGPFNLYSDVDGYTSPFESSVSKAALVSGYTSTLVPFGTNVIRVYSQGVCSNYIDLIIGTPPTTTTTTTECTRPLGLNSFALSYATNSPYFDFRGSLEDACASRGAEAYTGLTGQAVSLTIGQTVYFGLGTNCLLVPTGYYILDGGEDIIYILNGIVNSFPSCPTTTTSTSSTITSTTTTTTTLG